MRKFTSLICCFLLFQTINAQEGTPLLTHFRDSREIENQNWAISQDINKVMLFANRKGIIYFDGEDLVPLRLQIIPYSMKMNPEDKKIYIGGENNYGWLEKDTRGQYRYQSLSGDSAATGLITRILFSDSLAWFYSETTVSCHNLKNSQLEYRVNSAPENPFTGIITNSGHAFINVMNKGLFRVDADTLFPIVTGYLTSDTEILFSLSYDRKLTLTGFSTGKISLFDGIKYYDYPVGDEGYIADNILSDGIAVGDSLYAFSTLGGGAVVVEKLTGKVRYVINNQKGLPDDELFAIGYDSGGGLWMSHQFGLSRADLNLPVRNYSIYPGLKGNLTASLRFNDKLYVATSEGLYYLANEKTYTEVKVLRRNNVVPEVRKDRISKKQESTPALVSAPKVQNVRKASLQGSSARKRSQPVTRTIMELQSNLLTLLRYRL